MAQASIQARPAPIKARPRPDPALVYRCYVAEVMRHGKHGALRRTGDQFGYGREWARRVVLKHEQATRESAATPPELRYTPAPGELEYQAACARIARETAAQQLLAALLTPQNVSESPPDPPPAPPPDRRQDYVALAFKTAPVGVRTSPVVPVDCLQLERARVAVATVDDATLAARMAAAAAVLVTCGLLVIAARHPALALALLLPDLAIWHVAAEAQRLRRNRW